MLRSTPRLVALLLAASSLAGCGVNSMVGDLTGAPKKDAAAAPSKPSFKEAASDLDGNLRQAQLLRGAGNYDEAIHILSQLMLAAPDEPRVTAEYGKTLALKGRAQDATQFLRRAIELSSNDWTLYSALGVSYDQLNDPANARLAYEHALALKPGEAGVLNNYALSRMLAKDPDDARLLIAQAQAAAGAAPDAKIARNVELINGMVPKVEAEAAKPVAVASVKPAAKAGAIAEATPNKPAAKPAPQPAPQTAMKLPEAKIVAAPPPPKVAIARAPPQSLVPTPAPAPQQPPIPVTPMPVAQPAVAARAPEANGAPQTANDVSRLLASQSPVTGATSAPRPLAPQLATAQPAAQAPAGVVMQAVPYDPYAGPVITLKKPVPKPKAVAKADSDEAKPAKAAAAKPNVVPTLRVAADKY